MAHPSISSIHLLIDLFDHISNFEGPKCPWLTSHHDLLPSQGALGLSSSKKNSPKKNPPNPRSMEAYLAGREDDLFDYILVILKDQNVPANQLPDIPSQQV
jgi:hypothetical protein